MEDLLAQLNDILTNKAMPQLDEAFLDGRPEVVASPRYMLVRSCYAKIFGNQDASSIPQDTDFADSLLAMHCGIREADRESLRRLAEMAMTAEQNALRSAWSLYLMADLIADPDFAVIARSKAKELAAKGLAGGGASKEDVFLTLVCLLHYECDRTQLPHVKDYLQTLMRDFGKDTVVITRTLLQACCILREQLPSFSFHPILKEVMWGGAKLETLKEMPPSGRLIGESWEVSDVGKHVSVVDEGSYEGMPLTALVKLYGRRLLGYGYDDAKPSNFPILVKIIDARQNLSLQVHPNDTLATARHGSSGKSEMWYVMDAADDAHIICGFKKEMHPGEFEKMATDGSIMNCVSTHESHRGDVFYLPAGRVHSIGEGNLLVEVQQNVDITYRIFDYDRLDSHGKKRELHTDLAKEAIDFSVYPDYRCTPQTIGPGLKSLCRSPYFHVMLAEPTEEAPVDMPLGGSFATLTCVEGTTEVTFGENQRRLLCTGHTLLIPAEADLVRLSGPAKIVAATR